MNTYNLVVDRKITTWVREQVEVEADSLEEAIDLAIDGDYVEVQDREYFSFIGAEEPVYDKNGRPVFEVMDEYLNVLKCTDDLPSK